MKVLKVLTVMLFMASMGLTTSCSKDKDEQDLLIGKWEIIDGTRTVDGETGNYNDQGISIGFSENGDYYVGSSLRGKWQRVDEETIQVQRMGRSEWETEIILSLTQETLKLKKEFVVDGHSYVDIETLKRK